MTQEESCEGEDKKIRSMRVLEFDSYTGGFSDNLS